MKTPLGWLRNGEFAPIIVAEAKGFFAEEGIRHRILDGGPGTAFYQEYDSRIPQVLPVTEIMTNAFLPGLNLKR